MSVDFGMKFVGAVCVVAGSSGYGCWLAAQYKKRLTQLEQLRQMIFLLKGQILYANAPLAEAFETVGRRTKGALSRLFCQVAERIESQQGEAFYHIWQEEVERIGQARDADLVLTGADRQSLGALGEHLGFLDKEMQERTLLLYLEQLDMRIEQMREHKQERCRLYTSLGVMGGLFLTLLLI